MLHNGEEWTMNNRFPREIASGSWPYGHCQGIAVDKEKGYIYFSFTTALIKADLSGRVIGTVTGLLGHLGCIDFCEADGKVYGSLEYKNDIIGRNILARAGHAAPVQDAFYMAIFDADAITRMGMDACADGVMTAVYLKEVCEDYAAQVEEGGRLVAHRHGCSGIDGTTFGHLPGDPDGPMYLFVAYGVYSDVTRGDNDDQVLLCYDTSDWGRYARALSQQSMHTSGPEKPLHKLFVRTGNTRYGVQNLEYDEATGHLMMAVYRGEKPCFPNYDLYAVDGGAPVQGDRLALVPNGTGEETPGWRYPYGSTGLCSLGDGYFYLSQDGEENGLFYTRVVLCRWDGVTPFVPV